MSSRSIEDLLGAGKFDTAKLARIVSAAVDEVGEYEGGDTVNGHVFAEAHMDRLIYVPEFKAWMEFDGVRWIPTEGLAHMQAFAAKRLTTLTKSRMYRQVNKKSQRELLEPVFALFDQLRLQKAALESAALHPHIRKHAHELDADSWLLGVRNGVVDLRMGRLIDPEPGQYITKCAGCDYDEDATSDDWESFLTQALSFLTPFAKRAVGYSLAGVTDEEKLFFVHGPGASGKSTFANVVEAAFGDYSSTASKELLIKTKHASEGDRQILRLLGARMISINETATGDVYDDQKVKMITSREAIPARRLYGEAFAFAPTHTTWLRGNFMPGAHDAGDGFWRRIVPIEFHRAIPPDKRIPDLDKRLIAKALPAVLAWAVEGCLEWQRSGLAIPEWVQAATEGYRESTDLIGQWLEECTTRDAGAKAKVADLFASFSEFANAHGASSGFARTLSEDLVRRGFKHDPSRTHGRRIVGIRLRQSRAFDDE